MKSLVVSAALVLLSTAPTWAEVTPIAPLARAKTVQVTETTWVGMPQAKFQPVRESRVEMVIPVPGTAALNPPKPIRMRVEARMVTPVGSRFVVAQPPHPSLLVTDGITKWEYYRPDNVFREDAINPQKFHGSAWESQWDFTMPMLVLFSRASQKSGPFSWFKPAGTVRLDSKPMRMYRYMTTDELGGVGLQVLWVDAATRLPYRYSDYRADKGKPLAETSRYEYRRWVLDAPIADSRFSWTPPPAATKYVPPKRTPILADDTVAPNFTVTNQQGQQVHLADYAGKTVVLDFWATWCGPCQYGMRRTLPVARKYAPKGVVFLAVNVWDTKAAFGTWLPKHPEYSPFTFAIDTSAPTRGVASLYQVTGIPAQFVIDKDGKIVAGLSGFGGQELERAVQAATGETDRDAYRAERASLAKMLQDMQ